MLEARRVVGSTKLTDQFFRVYKRFYLKDNPNGYITDRLRHQSERQQKFGGTVFMQEPDIKNGVGGLRDYQSILWAARIKLDIGSLRELRAGKYLRADEYRDLSRAHGFLLRVRNQLHFSSTRPTDVLDLEKQPLIAWNLGYRKQDIFERVEAFMKDYYRSARNIYQISHAMHRRLALTGNANRRGILPGSRAPTPGKHDKTVDGFFIREDTMYYTRPGIFKSDPERLIRVFRHSQQFHARIDFQLREMITASLPLLDARVIGSHTAHRSFRGILSAAGEVFPILSEMHDMGVLERFLPEFSGLTCLVQHEYFHRYTADIHTLNTIRTLDEIFTGESEYAEKYGKILRDTDEPTVLYLILLLHDIGKGKAITGHCETGAEMAAAVLDRSGYPGDQKDDILFVIRNHLKMARIWQRHDIDAHQTIRNFAEEVATEERLRLLYVHAYCDTRGTDAKMWNSYKDSLHTQLFSNALAYIKGHRHRERGSERKKMISRSEMQDRVPQISAEELEAHFNLLPDRYFSYVGIDEIAMHLGMVNQFLHQVATTDSIGSLVPMIDWKDDLDLSMTVVDIVTWDRAGLFYKLAGAFSLVGLNIVSSRAISRSDHITIDTFQVCEPNGGIAQGDEIRNAFRRHLEEALIADRDLFPDIEARAKQFKRPDYLRQDEYLSAPIAPDIGVYHDDTLNRTIVEIHASDQIGALYRLTKTIYEYGFDITFARITTERGVIVDNFYLETIDPARQISKADLDDLRVKLETIITPEEAVC
jgi:[protein-PII] uridylyltransferase